MMPGDEFPAYMARDLFLQSVFLVGGARALGVVPEERRSTLRITAQVYWAHNVFEHMPHQMIEEEFRCCAQYSVARMLVTDLVKDGVEPHSPVWYTEVSRANGYRMHRCRNFPTFDGAKVLLTEFHLEREDRGNAPAP